MNGNVLTSTAIILFLAIGAGATEPPRPLASFFPQLQGWRMGEKAEIFLPETLYEHINGAADNFLNYAFEQLAVQNYTCGQKSLSVEIYFHGTPENAFGIYSSEKPQSGDYFVVGGQAYAEEGVLNFVSDAFYVKLNGFGLAADGNAILIELAKKIAAAIGGRNALPKWLAAFPENGKIANSERYILANFMGHDFLHSAYVADYRVNGQRCQLFLVTAGSEGEARAMLEKYAALDKAKSSSDIRPFSGLVINDPYNGPVQLLWQGKFICGCSGPAPAAAEYCETLARNLAKL